MSAVRREQEIFRSWCRDSVRWEDDDNHDYCIAHNLSDNDDDDDDDDDDDEYNIFFVLFWYDWISLKMMMKRRIMKLRMLELNNVYYINHKL